MTVRMAPPPVQGPDTQVTCRGRLTLESFFLLIFLAPPLVQNPEYNILMLFVFFQQLFPWLSANTYEYHRYSH